MSKEPTPKGPRKGGKLPVDLSLLKDEDKKALRDEAKASVLAEMKQDASDAYYQEEMARLRRAKIPADQLLMLTIDAAPYVPFIMLDGVQFYHGYTYEVTIAQASTINEIMQRTWQHQDTIDGRSRLESYRSPRNMRIGSAHAGTVTRGFATGATVDAEI